MKIKEEKKKGTIRGLRARSVSMMVPANLPFVRDCGSIVYIGNWDFTKVGFTIFISS